MCACVCSQSVESNVAQFIQKFSPEANNTDKWLKSQNPEDFSVTIKEDTIMSFNNLSDYEIFALTTGWAWEALQDVIDYNFPKRIAKRLSNPKVKKHGTKPLTDPVAQSQKIYVHSERISEQSAVENEHVLIQSKLRDTCSLEYIFDKMLSDVQLVIHKRLIRFLTSKIPQEKYCALLHHLSIIARQGDTYMKTDDTYLCSTSEVRSPHAELDLAAFEFLDDLQAATQEEATNMENWIYKQMAEYCQHRKFLLSNNTDQKLDKFCHKYVEDFYDASPITITTIRPKTLAISVTINNVLDAFLDAFIKGKNVDYNVELKNVKISFKRRNSEVIDEPLINYTEAEYYDEGSRKHFIRKGNMCYQLSTDYFTRIQENFLSVLNQIKKSNAYIYHESNTRDSNYEKCWPENFKKLQNQMTEKQKQLFNLKENKIEQNKNENGNEGENSSVPHCLGSAGTMTSSNKPREDREAIFNMTHIGENGYILGDKVSITYESTY
ncbi:unnamed protein product [Rotaria magnacalcarata]|uniref:Uncharacterized protein n=2 Tax=Rotaria magnacalcarata TaxID=392030 RepID=A0A816CC35_9BILA|nr:unnamed protein product [Rotaria magnacalcarata]CAF1669612.1 unnamed protein product [Rotaria magnacalcarata]CAF4195484.1 unnamed protein product [Rotaria magnacalcarata]